MLTSDDLAFFSVLAGSSSLAESARKLNVTPPAVTQRLRALEARLGVRLVDRTARGLSLTDEGALVAARGLVVSEALESLTEALAERRGTVSGRLRIAAPHGFGRVHIAPTVAAFARSHPAVTVGLELSDSPAARLVEACDVVIHIGPPGPPSQIMTTLAPNRRILCAAPGYLEAAPPIHAPADLASHRCLVVRENDEDVTLWRFQRVRHEPATVRVAPVMSSNDGAVVRRWALDGLGVTMRSEWDVAGDLACGRLGQILPDWEAPPADVVALVGVRHGRTTRTTAFLAFLRRSLTPAPWRAPTGA